ncbi:MAG: hypothetical protein AB1546_08775 [bacterium]
MRTLLECGITMPLSFTAACRILVQGSTLNQPVSCNRTPNLRHITSKLAQVCRRGAETAPYSLFVKNTQV